MGTQAGKAGHQCHMYINSATYATPTWVELALARDSTLADTRAKIEAAARDSDFIRYVYGLRDVGIDVELIWEPSNAAFTLVQAAYQAGTSIDMAVMDGDITVEGSCGVRADWGVEDLSRPEPLQGLVVASAKFSPMRTENPPVDMVIAAETTTTAGA